MQPDYFCTKSKFIASRSARNLLQADQAHLMLCHYYICLNLVSTCDPPLYDISSISQVVLFYFTFFPFKEYEFLGCWRGQAKRIVHNVFKHKELAFGPIFKEFASKHASIETCAKAAAKKRIDAFVITRDGCRGDIHTGLKFRRHGKSDSCKKSVVTENGGRVYGRGGKNDKLL